MFIKRRMAGQAAEPRGLLGRFAGRMMARGNVESNAWVISLLDPEEDDHVLEIGFGPGTAIREASRKTTKGHVAGIDISKAMVDQATSLNQQAVRDGQVDLRLGEAKSMPWPEDRFDKALAVNVIYLWPELDPVLTEIKRVLKPRGMLALYLAPLELMDNLGFSQVDSFTFHTPEEVERACTDAGFAKVEETSTQFGEGAGVCVMAWK
jgi:ubiquinone/menaquinone biosynthesis C-methylase UbiE